MTTSTDVVRPLLRTRQYRQFTAEPVEREVLDALLSVARWTGSGGNSQPWRFVVVEDVAMIRRLAEMAMPQTRALHSAMAALAISLPNEQSRATIDAYDEGRLAERVLIGASMLGLGAGITWIRGQFRPDIQRELGVADGRYVRTIIAIGHVAPEVAQSRRAAGEARLPIDELVEWRS